MDKGAIPDDDMVSPIYSDDPSNDWCEDEADVEEWAEQPAVPDQEEEPEAEPEYAWGDSGPQSDDDDRD